MEEIKQVEKTEAPDIEVLMEQARTLSKACFREGMNCSECVMRSFMEMHDTGLPDEAIAMASGFGGGIGQTKNICGAITGAVMALGMVKGRRDPLALPEMKDRVKELRNDVYPIFADMIHEIEAEYGTLICQEMTSGFDDFEGRPRKKNCQQIIMYCAALAAKYAAQ